MTPTLFEETDLHAGDLLNRQERALARLRLSQNGDAVSPSLRPYQVEAVQKVEAAQGRGVRRGLVVQATGTGKTVLASELVRRAVSRDGRPALFVAHRQELLDQALATFGRSGLEAQLECGEDRAGKGCDVVVASLQTVARKGTTRLDWLAQIGPSLMVYDEAHHSAAESGVSLIRRFGGFDGRAGMFIGLTATPHRLDNKPLDGTSDEALFEERLFEYGLVEAIRDGWLSPVRAFVIETPIDLGQVGTSGGDFKEGELANVVNTSPRTDLAIKHWKELASERPTIAFCVTVEHAQAVAEGFCAAGVESACVHGGLSRMERAAVLDRFRTGVVRVLTSCQLTTEGFDFPPTSCILMLRPTKSWSLYAQMVGRGTRLSPETGKEDCLVLDVVDLAGRHNLAHAPGLVGLPPVNMEGASLTDALEEVEGIEEGLASVALDRGTTWKEAISKAREVPLFAIETPAAVRSVSRFRWLAIPGGYFLGAGEVSVTVKEDPLGWQVLFTPKGESRWGYVVDGTIGEAIRRADETLKRRFPDACRLAFEGQWAQRPASEKTIAYCTLLLGQCKKKLGTAPQIGDPATLTQGQAGHLITQLKRMIESGAPAALVGSAGKPTRKVVRRGK